MRCPRCHSTNIVRIGHLIYCRNCISFGQISIQTSVPNVLEKTNLSSVYYDLSYDLSVSQKRIASEVVEAIHAHKHVLIQAVCGSGKTELVYPCICDALNQGKRVGFACPRKDLVIELYERLQGQLKNVEIALVYGGHHDDLYQPLVVLTTHQLYRYWQYFDVLIIDEVDAFPFYGNQSLYEMAAASNRGSFVLLSATSFQKDPPEGFVKFTLDRRYHQQDLPMPKLVCLPDLISQLYICRQIKICLEKKRLVMVFVPEKKDLMVLSRLLKRLKMEHRFVHSQTLSNTEILQEFRCHKFSILLTTTLLERGVTFENVQVFVYRADHPIFNQSTLIQIAGRVGRKPNYPTGLVVFVGKRKTKEMKACVNYVKTKNASSVTKEPSDSFKTKKIACV